MSMSSSENRAGTQPAHRVLGTAFVRVCVLPERRAHDTWLSFDPDDAEAADAASRFLRQAAEDQVVAEAVETASESLGAVLSRVRSGAELSGAQLRRAVLGTAKYLLRMSTRPTPFGLMAGVGVGVVESGLSAADGDGWVGEKHQRGVRPDGAWLSDYLDGCEEDPEVIRGLRIVPNTLCFLRGDRLVNPYPASAIRNDSDQRAREASVRMTEATRSVLDQAADAPTFVELCDAVGAAFPTAGAERIETLVRTLVKGGFLVTDLRPGRHVTDPLGHVMRRVGPARAQDLQAFADTARQLADAPVGEGVAALRELRATAKRLYDAEQLVQIDLRSDVSFRLPAVVGEEVADAAGALARLGMHDGEPDHLRDYREAFLERFGPDTLVPVTEVLDDAFGLGAPSGYRNTTGADADEYGAGRRQRAHGGHDHSRGDDGHEKDLSEWLQEALLSGAPEIVLDKARLTAAAGDGPVPDLGPHEACYQLLAGSMADVAAGDFRLVPSPLTGAPLPMTLMGRFMYLFPEEAERFAELAQATAATTPRARPCSVDYHVERSRQGNVSSHPALLGTTVPLGTFYDPARPEDVILPADIAIGATRSRLYAVRSSDGKELTPSAYSMLNKRTGMNNAARLLQEIGFYGRRGPAAWVWGTLSRNPYLPRVRVGRTVLSTARWRIPGALSEAGLSAREWDAALAGWRATWRVPSRVQMTRADNRLELDLDHTLHRRILRNELRRDPGLVLREALGEPGERTGWLSGYAHELVFQVMPAGAAADADHGHAHNHAASSRPTARRRRPAERHHPGGEWLYAKLYAPPESHAKLLAGPLQDLAGTLPSSVDRWFFIRYRDPKDHLRIRFHGDAQELAAVLLPRFHALGRDLCESGLAAGFALDTYMPETSRYGSGAVLTAAERVFCADSVLTMRMLGLAATGRLDLPPCVINALNISAMVRQARGDDWRQWILDRFAKPRDSNALREGRAAVQRALAADSGWQRLHAGGDAMSDAFAAAWSARAQALADYAEAVRRAPADDGPAAFDEALLGVLHMHHNRHSGIDRDAEQLADSLARAVVRAQVDRERFGS